MSKNLINVKNILKIIISCLVIFSMLKSCSMAYNIEDLYDYALQLQSMENVPSTVSYVANRIVTYYNSLKNFDVLQNAKSLIAEEIDENVQIFYYSEVYKINFNYLGNLGGLPNTHVVYISKYGNVKHYPNANGSFSQSPNSILGLIDLSLNTQDEIQNFNWSNWYLNNKYDEPINVNFTPYNDGNINVYYNGSSDTFLRFNFSRSVNQWALGKLDGLSDDVKVDLKLNRFMNGEFTTSVGSAQWYAGQKTSFGGLSIADDGVVYIKNDGIYYNQGYSLTFDVDGENVENYLFYFVPYAYSSSSGDLLSPDIDTNSDLEILQNLQDLVNIQNIGAIYDNSFGSGEIYNTLGYSDYDNIYSQYLKSCFQSLNDTFTLSGDVSVDVSFLGKNLTLRSSNFVVPDGPIKFFCSSFLVFGTIFYFYKQFSHFYHKLQEGDFESASETFAVDDESLLM